MKRIPLTQGKSAIVDDADFAAVSGFKWYAHKIRHNFYAARHAEKNGKRIVVYMHRVIIQTPAGKETDHRNGDGLDNRKRNLKICTRTENGANRPRLNSNNKSGHGGVYWYEKTKKWRAQISRNGRVKCIGYFTRKSDAIKARKIAEL